MPFKREKWREWSLVVPSTVYRDLLTNLSLFIHLRLRLYCIAQSKLFVSWTELVDSVLTQFSTLLLVGTCHVTSWQLQCVTSGICHSLIFIFRSVWLATTNKQVAFVSHCCILLMSDLTKDSCQVKVNWRLSRGYCRLVIGDETVKLLLTVGWSQR